MTRHDDAMRQRRAEEIERRMVHRKDIAKDSRTGGNGEHHQYSTISRETMRRNLASWAGTPLCVYPGRNDGKAKSHYGDWHDPLPFPSAAK